MVNTLSKEYEDIYLLNLQLLEIAKQGKWEDFIPLAEVYITKLNDVMNNQPADILADDKAALSVVLNNLIESEDEIEKTLRSRLDVLKNEMSSLHRGKKYSEAYSSQFTSAFH